jgi:hypothetical protein
MENDELPKVADVGFDERKETWFVDLRGQGRLELTRHTLAHLVRIYNEIHRGDPLYLLDQTRLNQMHTYNQRLSRTVRDLYRYIDKDREQKLVLRARRRLSRLIRRLLRLTGFRR